MHAHASTPRQHTHAHLLRLLRAANRMHPPHGRETKTRQADCLCKQTLVCFLRLRLGHVCTAPPSPSPAQCACSTRACRLPGEPTGTT
eukprot:363429-Chlamydomonas_euryale.AAC.5